MTQNNRKNCMAVFALFFMLGGCQAMTGETLGEHIDDATITTSVKTRSRPTKVRV